MQRTSTSNPPGPRYSDNGAKQVMRQASELFWDAAVSLARTGRIGAGENGYAQSSLREPLAPTRRNLDLISNGRVLAEQGIDLLRRLRADAPGPDSYTDRISEIEQATNGLRKLDATLRRSPDLSKIERGEFVRAAADEFSSINDQLGEALGNWD